MDDRLNTSIKFTEPDDCTIVMEESIPIRKYTLTYFQT